MFVGGYFETINDMVPLLCPIRFRQVILYKESVYSKIQEKIRKNEFIKKNKANKNSVQIYDKKQQKFPINKTQQKLLPADIRKRKSYKLSISVPGNKFYGSTISGIIFV